MRKLYSQKAELAAIGVIAFAHHCRRNYLSHAAERCRSALGLEALAAQIGMSGTFVSFSLPPSTFIHLKAQGSALWLGLCWQPFALLSTAPSHLQVSSAQTGRFSSNQTSALAIFRSSIPISLIFARSCALGSLGLFVGGHFALLLIIPSRHPPDSITGSGALYDWPWLTPSQCAGRPKSLVFSWCQVSGLLGWSVASLF